MRQNDIYLSPTGIIDSDHPLIIDWAEKITEGAADDPVEKAVKLYYAVRDGIRYNPYLPFYLPEHYRASNVLKSGQGFCITKASLLCALGRVCNIPTRVRFATVRNHLSTRQLIEHLGTDLIVYHGFMEFYLEGVWVKATPAFNIEICRRHGVTPLEFNGREDSVFQPYSLDGKKFMEYLEDNGVYADIPVEVILSATEKAYGKTRVRKWIIALEQSGGKPTRDFGKEDVL
jgi:transglutaminase-like putative cysteine protease